MKTTRRELLQLAAISTFIVAAPTIVRASAKYTIGFSQPLNNLAWRIAMTDVNKAYADKNLLDVELLITDAQNQATKQVADIESLLSRGIQVLMTSPLDQQALSPVIKEVMDSGVKVLTLDRIANTPVTCHMGAKNLPIGAAAGDFMAEKIGKKGAIIEIMGTAGSSAAIERSKGFRDAIAKYPDMKIVAEQNCDYARAPAVKFMEDMVQRFGEGEIQGVYAHADDSAMGAIQVLKESGRLKDTTVVSIDGSNAAFKAIADGEMAATFTYPFCAPEGIITAHKLAANEEVPAEIVLDGKKVTPDNVKDFLGKGFGPV